MDEQEVTAVPESEVPAESAPAETPAPQTEPAPKEALKESFTKDEVMAVVRDAVTSAVTASEQRQAKVLETFAQTASDKRFAKLMKDVAPQMKAFNNAVRLGTIDDAQAKAAQTAIWADAASKLADEEEPRPQPQQQPQQNYDQRQVMAAWNKRLSDVRDIGDLTGEEPEYKELMQGVNFGAMDWESADRKHIAIVKEARKRVDARVNKTAIDSTKKKVPPMEVGGGKPAEQVNHQEELQKLIDQGPPSDPKKHKEWLKRQEEHAKALGWE